MLSEREPIFPITNVPCANKSLTSMSEAPVMPARLLARAMASAAPGDSSTPTMILLMTVPSLVVDEDRRYGR